MTFTVLNADTAPAITRETLESIKEQYDFLPNIIGIMAGAPALLEAYAALDKLFKESSFTPAERYVVLLTTSITYNCAYCVALYSKAAESEDIAIEIIDDLRSRTTIDDDKLEALRQYTSSLLKNNGHPDSAAKDNFLRAGYKPQQALEILLATNLATLVNHASRLAHPSLDNDLLDTRWKMEDAA